MPPSPDPHGQQRRLAFGAVVRHHRLTQNRSQETLAKFARCDRQSINRIENGAYSPSLDRLYRLADALDTPLADLLAEAAREPVSPYPAGDPE